MSLLLLCTPAFSKATPHCSPSTHRTYAGIFGGFGAMTGTDLSQHGTIFFLEAAGGPLPIEASGSSGKPSTGLLGAHIGVSWCNRALPVVPAIELEGYYMGNINIEENLINDFTRPFSREDNFLVNYPIKTGVFLTNIVLNSSGFGFCSLKPYVGLGIGTALFSVSDASAIQLDPIEVGINHYNSDPDDKALTFAAQGKIGVGMNLGCAKLFAEYRLLYLSKTNYIFGSAINPGHATTSPWIVKVEPQYYNLGVVGVEFEF